MASESENKLRRLELPRRWELLEQRAEAEQIDIGDVIERVDAAATRVDQLLRRVREGGGGVIEVFYGLSGSGKTTFLQTLGRFFENIRISTFSKDLPLEELPSFIVKEAISGDTRNRIVLISRRDNPTAKDLAAVEEMFGQLLDTFREPNGAAVVLWPITKLESAKQVAETAWAVGRDSMADVDSEGQFKFLGVEKAKYWSLADNTSRTLTGDGLEAYGVTAVEVSDLLPRCETISDYFNAINKTAATLRDDTWSVLKERVTPHLWIVLPGDDDRTITTTVGALTQGIQSKLDVEKLGELIDQADQKTLYVQEWRGRRGKLGHLLRTIDLRLFGLPPNVSVAAVRAFGDTSLKNKLKQPVSGIESAKGALRATRLYKAVLREAGVETSNYAGPRRIGEDAIQDFVRVQTVASTDDKPLNKALGQLFAACLADDAPQLKVTIEKRNMPGSALQPDIRIELRPGEFICLEPTWRTSGVGIPDEVVKGQNTLSEAHVKIYALNKATQYIKDLGI